MPDEAPTDSAAAPTVLDRMLAAGIDRARAISHLEASGVMVDGVRVSDPDLPAPPPARITVASS